MRHWLATLLLWLFAISAASAETCIASVYSTKDHDQNGTATASGIPLSDRKPTMARPTRVHLLQTQRVTNLDNGRSELLRVTDVGPNKQMVQEKGRCVDLSVAAAVLLGCKGLCPVRVGP